MDPGGIPTTPNQSYPSHQRTQGVSYTHHPTPVLPQPSSKGPWGSVTPTTPHQSYPSHQRTLGVSYTHHPTPVLPQPSKDPGGQLHPPPHTSLTTAIKGPRVSVAPTTLCQSYPSHQRTQVSYTPHSTPVLPQPSGKGPRGSSVDGCGVCGKRKRLFMASMVRLLRHSCQLFQLVTISVLGRCHVVVRVLWST